MTIKAAYQNTLYLIFSRENVMLFRSKYRDAFLLFLVVKDRASIIVVIYDLKIWDWVILEIHPVRTLIAYIMLCHERVVAALHAKIA